MGNSVLHCEDLAARRKNIQWHINLLKRRYSEPRRREMVGLLNDRLANVLIECQTGRQRFARVFRKLFRFLLPYIAEAVIRGFLPERIGRYNVLDYLLELGEGENG